MRSRQPTTNDADQQQFQLDDEMIGEEDQPGVVDTTIGIKTVSVNYCGFTPERCKTLNNGRGGRVVLGRISGKMFGTERQLRNPKEVAEGTAEADWGIAAVGEFTADRYGDDGEVIEYEGGFCYFPGGLHERVLARFQGLTPEQQGEGYRVSYFIAAEPSNNLRGYRYVTANAQRVEEIEGSIRLRLKKEAALILSGKLPVGESERLLIKPGALPLLMGPDQRTGM